MSEALFILGVALVLTSFYEIIFGNNSWQAFLPSVFSELFRLDRDEYPRLFFVVVILKILIGITLMFIVDFG